MLGLLGLLTLADGSGAFMIIAPLADVQRIRPIFLAGAAACAGFLVAAVILTVKARWGAAWIIATVGVACAFLPSVVADALLGR
jgi:hypothetical protein